MPQKVKMVERGTCKLSNAKLEDTVQETIGAGSIGEILWRMFCVSECCHSLSDEQGLMLLQAEFDMGWLGGEQDHY